MLLPIDGIQPDKGNETIYLVRDVLTGRILTAENVTESTKERLKQVLAPVVALGLPVIGVISDAQPTELQAMADLWPGTPHQICQFHALREAGRLIFVLDQRTKTEMRIRMQQKNHEYRQNMHKRVRQAKEKQEGTEQALAQLEVLEEYAAIVEGALNVESLAPFDYVSSLAPQVVLSACIICYKGGLCVHNNPSGIILCRLPIQYITQCLSELVEPLVVDCLIRHSCISP